MAYIRVGVDDEGRCEVRVTDHGPDGERSYSWALNKDDIDALPLLPDDFQGDETTIRVAATVIPPVRVDQQLCQIALLKIDWRPQSEADAVQMVEGPFRIEGGCTLSREVPYSRSDNGSNAWTITTGSA